jgi:FAD/FMN-containing dehydrogenase
MVIRNFGRTWKFSPMQFARPASTEELMQVIKNAASLRPVGAKHSWSKGIVTDEVLVSLENLNKIYELDKELIAGKSRSRHYFKRAD